jgi:hypothetical protein
VKVSVGSITLDFRKPTIRDSYLRQWIFDRLRVVCGDSEGGYIRSQYLLFARVASQTTESEGLPFSLPTGQETDSALQAAYEAWSGLDEDLSDQCFDALEALKAPADPATGAAPLAKGAPKN